MAITSFDGIVASHKPKIYFDKTAPAVSVINTYKSFWGATGIPGSGDYDTSLVGVALSSSTTIPNGSLPHYDPGSGNAYLHHLIAQTYLASGQMNLFLADRLWHNGNFSPTLTTVQSLPNSASWPTRDANGATTGVGVMLGVEASVGVGTQQTITVKYTNTAGVSGQTATVTGTAAGLSNAGSFGIFNLAAGDLGVQSVQSAQWTVSMVSGTVNLVAFRVLAALTLRTANLAEAIDCLKGGFPRLYNGTVPFFFCYLGTATTPRIAGVYGEAWG